MQQDQDCCIPEFSPPTAFTQPTSLAAASVPAHQQHRPTNTMSKVCVIAIDDPAEDLKFPCFIKSKKYRKNGAALKSSRRFAEKCKYFGASHRMLQLKQGIQDWREQLPKAQLLPASSDSLPTETETATDSNNSAGSARRTNRRFWLFVLGMVAFLGLGGLVFRHLEAEHEENERRVFREYRQQFLDKHEGLQDAELEDFIELISRLSGRGVIALQNATAPASNWDWGQSFFFAGTLVTTIGYGYVTPITGDGRAVCVLYALVGIPLMLVLISTVVNRMRVLSDRVLAFMLSFTEREEMRFYARLAHLLLFVTLFMYLFIVLPTMLLCRLEPTWSQVDALFYCFVTMATIGQGDNIPGDQPLQKYRGLYKVLITVYLMLGLCAVMLCVDIYNEIPELSLGQLFRARSEATEADAVGVTGAVADARSAAGGKRSTSNGTSTIQMPAGM